MSRRLRGLTALILIIAMLPLTAGAQRPRAARPEPSAPPVAGLPAAPERSAHPEAVLWDQPASTADPGAFLSQEFTDLPQYSTFLADDFSNSVTWSIGKIFVPGNGFAGFSSLYDYSALTWQIYCDVAGVPDGDPSGAGNPPFWTLTLPPTDAQVTISNGSGGMPSNTLLTLGMPATLPAGHWWLVFYPAGNYFPNASEYGRQGADTAYGRQGQWINPGNGYGRGSAWIPWGAIGASRHDIAFRLEGEPIPAEHRVLLPFVLRNR